MSIQILPSLRKLIVLAILITTAPLLSDAFESINVGSTIVADQSTRVTIVNDLSSGSGSFDAQFSAFRLYLAYAPPGWGLGPACYLVDLTSINTTSLDVQIPTSVGPSSSGSPSTIYALSTVEIYDPDSSNDMGGSGFEYSDSFDFQGGTGNWSQYELDGYPIALIGDVPCSAFDCARQCAQKYYPGNLEGDDVSSYKTTYECIAACPGVTYPPFDTIYGNGSGGGGGGDGGGIEDGQSSGAAPTGTSLAAAGGFTQINPSSTAAVSVTTSSATGLITGPALTPAANVASTVSPSTPSASKSAAVLAMVSQYNALFIVFSVLASLLSL